MISTADISSCGTYRYRLTREWDRYPPYSGSVLWIMLNPSTADASVDDATIRKCVGFSKLWGFGKLEVVNLFAFRATKPADLKRAEDPCGPRNAETLTSALAGGHGIVVGAWGTHGSLGGAGSAMLERLKVVAGGAIHLGLTKGGHPKHPLMLAYNTPRTGIAAD